MSSSEIGRKIGKFTFVRELGEGGMGKVYLARQESLDRNVAIKILHSDLARDDVFLQRFHREAKAAAVFQHPNVVAVIDADQDEETGDHYICFEFVDGSSLEDMIKLQPLTEKRTIEIARAVAEALEYAASKGIVHRDVKPDNIMIDTNGVPKLADLGLAKTVDARAPAVTQPGMIVGTPLYMAPEQALGYEEVDIRADLYSLGLVMWRMVTGKVPFDEEGDISSLHVLSRHINEDLPDVLKHSDQPVTEELARVIHWASARDRNDRYPTAKALAADLMRLENNQPPLGPLGENAQRTVSMPASDVPKALPDKSDKPDPKSTTAVEPAKERDRSTDTPPHTPAAVVVPKPSKKTSAEWAPPSDMGKPPVSIPVLALVVGLLLLGLGLVWATRKDPDRIAKVVDGKVEPSPTATATEAPSPTPTATERPDDPQPTPTRRPVPTGDPTPTPTDPPSRVDPPDPTPSPRPTPSASPTPDEPSVKPPGAEGIDLTNEAGLVEHINATTRDLLSDVVTGRRRFQQILWSDGWEENRALKRYVLGTQHALALLRPGSAEVVRGASRSALRAMIRIQKRTPLPGRTAAAVDRSIETWDVVGEALERIWLTLRDPRGSDRTLGSLRKHLGRKHAFTLQVEALIELTEAADWNRDWSQSPQRRVGVARRQQALNKRLEGSAISQVFSFELKVVGRMLHVILRDADRSVLSAIEQLDPIARKRSHYLKVREQGVPARAALAKLPASGLRIQLGPNWGSGQLRIVVDGGPDLIFDGSGLLAGSRTAITWGTPPVILIEPQANTNLILLPGSRPYRLTSQRKRVGRGLPRFTVRPRSVSLTQVRLLQLPPRGARRPPGTRWVRKR